MKFVLQPASTGSEREVLTKLREFITERELSLWLGLSQPTLSRQRRDRTGPAFIRLSARRVAYSRVSVERWLKDREQKTISAAGPQ